MGRRLLIFIAGLALSITLKPTPTTAQQREAKQNDAKLTPADRKAKKDQSDKDAEKPEPIPPSPITIQGTVTAINQPSPEEKAEQAKKQAETVWERALAPERWPDIGLVIVGTIGTIVGICRLRKLHLQGIMMLASLKETRKSNRRAAPVLH